jgi:hypothetical protein
MTHRAGRLALVLWLAGAVTIAVTWYDSGEQASSATQLPSVVVALGAGLGQLVVGSALWVLDGTRVRDVRAARLLARATGAAP